jgi:proteasome lid subunit RPN8/RPN11
MIFLSRAQLKEIADAAEAAYPGECCGLIVGRPRGNADLEVARLVASPNVSGEAAPEGARRDRFEVDPELRLKVQRELGDGPERIIGLYHSHPGHGAQPSAFDLESVWEPEFVWLITAVEEGQAVHTTAHVLDPEGRQFREIGLRTTDWKPYPVRGPLPGKAGA